MPNQPLSWSLGDSGASIRSTWVLKITVDLNLGRSIRSTIAFRYLLGRQADITIGEFSKLALGREIVNCIVSV